MRNETPPSPSPASAGRPAAAADADRQPIVEARGVEKYFVQPDGRRIQIIAPLDLTIEKGEIVALLGPSGSGKSTLLRILSGLVQPSAGTVLWQGRPLGEGVANVGVVFQNFALFPWITVLENVEAPLEARGIGAIERRKRALRMLDVVGLDGYETAYPKELSGGMKQRVGFARALVIEPTVLFMDEPFSALDVLTAENLRGELLELWLDKKMPTTTIFMVTHNIEEAVLLADRIIVLSSTPAHVLARFRVDLPRPRERGAPGFIELVDLIYGVLTRPTADVAARAAGERAAPAAGPVPDRFVRLPHARPGGIL